MSTPAKKSRLRWTLGSAGLLVGTLALGLALTGRAADHRDGPLFSNTPANGRADVNDIYVFRSPADTSNTNFGNTVIVATISPFPGVLTPTSFDTRLTFEVNVIGTTPTNAALPPDLKFQVTFARPTGTAPFTQVATLKLTTAAGTTSQTYNYVSNQVIPPASFANNVTFPGDATATGKFIAGNFDDPFFFDAQGFGDFLANPAAKKFPRPRPVNPARPAARDAKNFFANANTLAIVLEVPTAKLTANNPPRIAVCMDSKINGTQVDRMGRPAINTALVPPVPRTDLSRGDRRTAFNQGSPGTDVANFRADLFAVLTNPNGIYKRTQSDAAALLDSALGPTVLGPATGLLPDVLTVDLSKQFSDPTYQGFPNGRRLRDDVIDIELNLLTNGAVKTDNVDDDNGTIITDGVKGAAVMFPYIGRPNTPPKGPNP
jgi:hypothetical protein